jgi:hypothetical protein
VGCALFGTEIRAKSSGSIKESNTFQTKSVAIVQISDKNEENDMVIKQKPDISSPEILFTGGSDLAANRQINRLAAQGQLLKLYKGIYTNDLISPPASVVRRHWISIVSYLLPGGVLSYRSGYDAKPHEDRLYVTRGSRPRTLVLPGLTIKVLPGPIEGDMPYKGVFLASQARWLLDNLAVGRGAGERTLLQVDLEQALARAAGHPYDPNRLALFDTLFSALRLQALSEIEDTADTGVARENFAFFESYFSNYIEGTTFLVREAEEIVFQGELIANRAEDSHDILGTFRAAMQSPWRDKPASTATEFQTWLKSVNALVMQSRMDKQPGQWKDQDNQAESTLFVSHVLVQGTLKEGFERISALEDPFARALMTMFVILEVHPFKDGNGRTARLAMNAVLSAAGLSRIIVPTVYREDYLLPLKSMSNHADPSPYIRAMSRIQNWTAAFNYAQPRQALHDSFKQCHAFEEDLRRYRLVFP